MKRILAVLISVFLGCQLGMAEQPDISNRTKIYEADYITVLKALMTYCNESGYPIKTIDKELGIVNTDYKMSTRTFLKMPVRSTLNISITKLSEKQTKVVVIINDEIDSDRVGNWQAGFKSDGEVLDDYKEFFKAIDKVLLNQ